MPESVSATSLAPLTVHSFPVVSLHQHPLLPPGSLLIFPSYSPSAPTNSPLEAVTIKGNHLVPVSNWRVSQLPAAKGERSLLVSLGSRNQGGCLKRQRATLGLRLGPPRIKCSRCHSMDRSNQGHTPHTSLLLQALGASGASVKASR